MFRSRHFLVKVCPGVITVPSGIVTSVTNCANGQLGVAEETGVLVTTAEGISVIVGWRVGVAVDGCAGVALINASTVWAAEVARASSGLLEGRLQALIKIANMIKI